MTTRTMGGMAAALLAAAGLCRGTTSDNQNQVAPAKQPVATPRSTPALADGEWENIAASFGGSKADTKPSRDAVMQFTFSAEVREINAVGGQNVKKGFVLMRARDADVVAANARQKDLASNELEIQGTEQQLRLAEFKFEQIKASGTYSPTEFEEADIGRKVARVQHEQAKRNKKQQELTLIQAEAQHERYWLEAPFDGIIEEVMVEVGEGVTEQTKVLRIVNTEKMWLDPYADTRETIRLGLKEGSPAWVLIDMPDAPKLVRGKVLYVSPVADSVSQTRRVRVEIENPKGWPAGTQARVKFVEPSGEWEKYQVKGAPSAATSSAEEIRRTVEQMLNDAETRSSLLAGGDASSDGRFFIAGDGVAPMSDRMHICYRLPQPVTQVPFEPDASWLKISVPFQTNNFPIEGPYARRSLASGPSDAHWGGCFIFGEPGTNFGDYSK